MTRWSLLLLLSSIGGPLLAAAPGVGNLATRTAGFDWPGFLGSDGRAESDEGPVSADWPAGGLPVVWHREVGEGYSAPSIDRGRLFLFDRVGEMARLTCLRAETGEELWQVEYATQYEDLYQFSNGPRTSPVVDGDRVYTFGVEGRLRCHRVADGSLVWDVDTSARFGVVQNFFGVGSTPIVHGDRLIVPVGGSPEGSKEIQSGEVEPDGSAIVAFDKRSGEVRYVTGDDLASYASPVVGAIDGKPVVYQFGRRGLFAFDPANGDPKFHFPWRSETLESVNAANPLVLGDRVLISECYGPGSALLRVGSEGPEVVWKDPPGRGKRLLSHWATPVHHEGTVYGCHGRNSGDAALRALDLATGEVLWSEAGLGRVTLLLVDAKLLVWGEFGQLQLVRASPEGYERLAEMDLSKGSEHYSGPRIDPPAWNGPVLARGLLYLRGKRELICLELIPAGTAN